jgi:uncharacterized protein
MQTAQRFLGVTPQAGKVTRERVVIGQLPDGTALSLPVIIIAGKTDGRTIYLQSGLHGDELTGVATLHGIVSQLDPADISGTVVAVPYANPAAVITKSRGFAIEERGPFDLNRIFPGSASGTLSERIAFTLFHEFVLAADYTVDFHSALAGCNIHPFVYIDPDDDDTGTLAVRERMGRAFGAGFLSYRKARGSKLGTSNMGGSISSQADQQRKPVLAVEMGESGRISWDFVERGVRGGMNMLREMGILAGETAPVEEQRTFSKISLIHSDMAGLFAPRVQLGQQVREGQILAKMSDAFTGETREVVAPHDGIVLRLMLTAPVMTGAELFWVVR